MPLSLQVFAAAGHGRAGAGNRDGLLQSRQSQCYAGSQAGAFGRGTPPQIDNAATMDVTYAHDVGDDLHAGGRSVVYHPELLHGMRALLCGF